MADELPQTRSQDITDRSILVGLLGRGIALSQSPKMHEREGLRLGLNYVYRRLDFDVMGRSDDDLADVLSSCEAFGFSGVNVTHPFKQRIVPMLNELSSEARAIGAVNTVVFESGRWIGHNTDCWGFAQSFRDGLPQVGRGRVLLAGAGGAGRAVCQALAELGFARIDVYDSNTDAAAATAAALSACNPGTIIAATSDPRQALVDAEGLVNATPSGMAKYPGTALPAAWLTPQHWVADIVYFPENTELITAARALGCSTLTGGGMAIYQAVRAFELFSGVRSSASEMAAARSSA